MFNNLYNAADEIRTLLMPFAFLLCVIGIGEMGWRAGSDTRAILGALLKSIVIVTLIAGYPDIMKGGQAAFIRTSQQVHERPGCEVCAIACAPPSRTSPRTQSLNIGKIVPAAIGYFFQGIGRFMLLVLRFFQEFAIAGLIAVSPLLIGFLFFSYTQSLGVHFGVTSLTVLLWHVAICLVDIMIQPISDVLFLPITTGGLVQAAQNMIVVQNWLHFPFIMAFARLSHGLFLSLRSVRGIRRDERPERNNRTRCKPVFMARCRPQDWSWAQDLRSAGAAATFGGSAAAQAAIEGTKFAANTASSAGRIANDLSGVSAVM